MVSGVHVCHAACYETPIIHEDDVCVFWSRHTSWVLLQSFEGYPGSMPRSELSVQDRGKPPLSYSQVSLRYRLLFSHYETTVLDPQETKMYRRCQG